MDALEDLWPLFGLSISAGPVELRPIRDEEIRALVDVAREGIHDPDAMPFYVPWTAVPEAELGRNMAVYRVGFTADRWGFEFAVRWHGEIVGCQGLSTQHYRVTRTGETGSWLGRAYQGQGVGTRMRQAMCAFLFDHLGAEEITSGAFLDSPASLAVSRKVGYRPNGRFRVQRREGELAVVQQLVLTPDDFVRPENPLIVTGVEGVRRMIGLD